MVLPRVSITVAVTVLPLPEVTYDGIGGAARDGQRNRLHGAGGEIRGWLFTLPLLATSEVIPGVCAVTAVCPVTGHSHGRAVGGYGRRGCIVVDGLPGERPHGAGDVQPTAEGVGLVVEALIARKSKGRPAARSGLTTGLATIFVDVLMHVLHRRRRTADPVRPGGHLGRSTGPGSANLRRGQRIPGAGARWPRLEAMVKTRRCWKET